MDILAAEDEEIQRLLLKEFADHSGYSMDTVATSQAAIDKIRQNSYDVLLVDRRLPDFNGEAVVKVAKTESPETTVVMISGDPPVTLEKDIRSQLDGFLGKPYNIGELRSTIERVSPDASRGSSNSGQMLSGDPEHAHQKTQSRTNEKSY